MPTEKRIECLGVSINYIDVGKGDVLIFLHNGGGFWQIWSKQIEYFQKTHRVLALDWPGFGESSESNKPYSLDFNTQILKCFLDSLKMSKVTLIGNCIGASIAINFSNLYPERVDKRVLMNICPGERLVRLGVFRSLIFKKKSDKFQSSLKILLTFIATKTFVKNKFPKILFGQNPDKKSQLFVKYEYKMKEAKQNRSRTNLLFTSNTYTLEHFLSNNSIVKDSLLLWGEFNKVANVQREGIFHQTLCGIEQLHIIKNSGHLLMYESGDEVNELIEGYIS
ncbi:MAG: alpha/beta hydrolase [Bacteroidetes bacterium]|nr:alpha/beta hydrolase [Bacteroidota bacterium]MBT7995225.1 alpha/beta hydrolase [Bacteroidota bacterium]